MYYRINRVSNSEDKGICDFNAPVDSIVFTAIVVTRVDRNFNLINSWQTLFLAISAFTFGILCFFRVYFRKSSKSQLQEFIRSFLETLHSKSERKCIAIETVYAPIRRAIYKCMYVPILNPTLVTESLEILHARNHRVESQQFMQDFVNSLLRYHAPSRQ